MSPAKQAVYINASASLSALGYGNELTSKDYVINNQVLSDGCPLLYPLLYQSVKGLALAQSFERIYQQLFVVIDDLLAQLSLTEQQLAETTLFLGSSSLDISGVEVDLSKTFWLSDLDQINKTLVEKYGFEQLNFTFNTACTASANALLYAGKLIEQGAIKQALVIGCEFYNELTIKGFSSLELISSKGQFSLSQLRDGLVLGEGVGALFLTSTRQPHTKLQLLGGYSSCDTYSLTTTQEDGSHIKTVIAQSLVNAGVTPEQIDLIKVHATASLANDQAEVAAIKQLFKPEQIKSLALKPFIGHTLGACGVLEIALLDQLSCQDFMPVPSYAVEQPELNLLPFVAPDSSINQYQFILANHFGFGGNNAALVLKNLTYTGPV